MNIPTSERFREAKRITLIGSLVDVLLGIFKVFIGVISHSQALIADGVHSFSDLLTDFLVLFVAKYSHAAPDQDHPYGHERFETFGTVLLGSFLIAVAGAIVYDATERLITQDTSFIGGWGAIVVTIVSIVSKEFIFQISDKVGKKLKSDLLIANAWHSRSDSFSSIVVLVGIIGAMFGYWWLDGVAAVIVAFMIGYIGWTLAYKSVRELVDTGIDQKKLDEIRQKIFSVEGVRGVHSLRSRRMGSNVLLDVHLEVDPFISASEGHHIGVWVEQKLLNECEEIYDVVFHIDAVGQKIPDADAPLLPLRNEVFDSLKKVWHDIPFADQILNINLFYLEEAVLVEVIMSTAVLKEPGYNSQQFKHNLIESTKQLQWIESIAICYAEAIKNRQLFQEK